MKNRNITILKPGDIVRKGGIGPKMLINEIVADNATVVWFDDSDVYQEAIVKSSLLQKVFGSDLMTFKESV